MTGHILFGLLHLNERGWDQRFDFLEGVVDSVSATLLCELVIRSL